ncbi:hypothetical protein U9M48_004574 [Paspalum notatum var. saurae]
MTQGKSTRPLLYSSKHTNLSLAVMQVPSALTIQDSKLQRTEDS